MRAVERPEAEEVEDRAQVDLERLVPLAGEDLAAVRERVHRRGGQRLVVGRRARADVDRRRREVAAQHRRHAVVAADHAIALPDVEVRVVERGDGPRVVEERIGVLDLRPERELVRDLRLPVPVVVDVDVVEDVVAELVEVRPSRRLLERDEVGDEHDLVGLLGVHEGVDVGVVRARVLADERRLPMARGERRPGDEAQQRERCAGDAKVHLRVLLARSTEGAPRADCVHAGRPNLTPCRTPVSCPLLSTRMPEWPPRRNTAGDPFADLRQAWRRSGGQFRGFGGGGHPSRLGPRLVRPVLLLLWLASGIYIVRPDEKGVVLRFGAAVREVDPGPHWRLPWPFEEVLKPSVTQILKEEIGFRTTDPGPPARYQDMDNEALMLTGDENIVKLQFIVQYKVRTGPDGVTDYLFNVRDPRETIRSGAEAAMREVVGRTGIDSVLTEGKEKVQQEAQAELQSILDLYDVGIEVLTVKLQDVDPPDQVSDAFKDVISAQQDRERLINEARGYENDVVPRARGQAAQILNEAEGYSAAKVREATGVAQRFVALQEEYAKAKDVTRRRLYLETMEAILPDMNKIVMDDLSARQAVPYLPLDQLKPRTKTGVAAE